MFGYVQTYKDELKIKEYNAFRAYYCGLCKTLKAEYGFSSRLGLNYDSVFLALLLSSVTDEEAVCRPERCIANPLKKRPVMQRERCLSYSAGVMLILALLKIEDNLRDEHSVKAAFSYLALLRAKRRVIKKHGALYHRCKQYISALSRLEKENCTSIDALSHEFASLMQVVFTPDFIEHEATSRILGHIGYLLGRFIYILDACEDLEKDAKKHCFNPFLAKGAPPEKEALRDSLTFTLSSIANDYALLHIKRNKPILDNIIYLGLPATLDRVIDGKGEPKDERSL